MFEGNLVEEAIAKITIDKAELQLQNDSLPEEVAEDRTVSESFS